MNGSDCDAEAAARIHAEWTQLYFGECVVNWRQYIAFFIGLTSTFFNIIAQWPQVVTSCKTGTAHQSLSLGFLLLWLFSDATNMLGAILTKQLFTQILSGLYYVFMDLLCILQYLLHYWRDKGFCGIRWEFRGYQRIFVIPMLLLLPGVASLLFPGDTHPSEWKSRRLLEITETTSVPSPPIIDGHDTLFITGYVLGWISSLIYFFAVPQQIIKNFRRGSVEGLSTWMFGFTTLTDGTYLLSVVIFRTDVHFVVQKLPWSSGAAFSLFYDIIIMLQIMFYKSKAYVHTVQERSFFINTGKIYQT